MVLGFLAQLSGSNACLSLCATKPWFPTQVAAGQSGHYDVTHCTTASRQRLCLGDAQHPRQWVNSGTLHNRPSGRVGSVWVVIVAEPARPCTASPWLLHSTFGWGGLGWDSIGWVRMG